jgi:outer membrane protein assembly factor BamE (lipoprotein component of BamABCDE complex)
VSGGKRLLAVFAIAVAACGAMAIAACGSDDGAVGLGTAGCLSDQQICQFKKGVSTRADVQKALGNPQISLGASAWSYVCQQISGNLIRNEQTIFDFDDSGVLSDVTTIRVGSSSAPGPDCSASGGAGGAPP